VAIDAERPLEELLAVKVRHDFDLGRSRIDPTEVAHRLGLEVVAYPVEDNGIEGQYRPLSGGGGAIFVNSRSGILRQRFTVAHEIGHALLHREQTVVDDEIETRSRSKVERQADRFAGALLVDPAAAARILAGRDGYIDATVAEIVAEFEVSVPTAAIALEQFALITRKQLDDFLTAYQATSHRAFMESHGYRSRYRPGTGRLVLDPAYKTRIADLLSRGQLNPERAAALLGTDVKSLPKAAVAAHERLVQAAAAEPGFE
jgi:Zn-dependent peptidase ImmA (M78 family)